MKTIYKTGTSEVIEKKSKFIGKAYPVLDEPMAQKIIEKIKKENYNANHNVFAYQIGDKNQIKRYSDDKEPSGTAGVPLLSILEKEDLKNILVIVTRYFGGVLLGTGGLVKAYGKAGKDAILDGVIINKILYNKVLFDANYNLSGKIKNELLNNNIIINNMDYSDNITFDVCTTNLELLQKILDDLSSGQIKPIILPSIYGAVLNNEIVFNF